MMHWISPAWIVQTLIASSLLMALVFAIRGPVMRMFGAKIAYALWLLPALRMVLPPLPGHHTLMIPVASLRSHGATPGLVDPVHAASLVATPIDPHPAPELVVQYAPMDPPPMELHAAPMPMAPPPHPIDWTTLALTIWLGGAALLFVTQLIRYRLFLDRALKDSLRLSRECGIDVLVSDHVPGPIAAGIFKRRILLPGNFLERYSSEERRLALRHEAAHHDRWDIPANLLALGIVALHWWNPLAHRAYRAFRADQELACDATVLGDASATERHSYGSAMLKSASGHMPAMACALSHKEQLKKRIMMMAHSKFGPLRLMTGAALAVTAIGGGLLLTATGEAQTAPARIETIPVPPSVPTPPMSPMKGVPPVPPAPPAPIAMAAPPAPPVPPVHLAAADRDEARKSAECARKEAEKAREAGRQAAEAGREAAEAGREAGRQAALAGREAAHQAAAYARHSQDYARQAAEARRVAMADMPNTAELIRTSMESAKAGLRAACDAQGVKMPAGADIARLATCGDHIQRIVLASLRTARAEVAGDPSIPADARAQALAGIDAALASNSARLNGNR